MRLWVLAAAAGGALALILYGWRGGGLPGQLAILALLRAFAFALLAALLLGAPAGPRRPAPPLVALDVSASWLRGGDSARWNRARALALAAAGRGRSVLLVGDSVRVAAAPALPTDNATRIAPLAERALGAGRPLALITDGEVNDLASARELPAGSRLDVLPAARDTDRAVTTLDAPRGAERGDTIAVRVGIRAGNTAVPPGTLLLALDGRVVTRADLPALAARGEMTAAVSLPVVADTGARVLSAIASTPGDVEPRNDTLAVSVDIARASGAVVVSTAPDFDLRFMLPVLRGALALPVRAYYRVAPGEWRREGTLSAVPEREVVRALREAPVAMLHGDTALFGAPRRLVTGSLLLFAPPPATGDEWYPVAAPSSPLSAPLAEIPWDSLPPLDVAQRLPESEWTGLLVALARGPVRRPAVVGSGGPRRVIVMGAAGLWRWAFRGGTSADAYAALWGSIFDWLSAERGEIRAAVPADGLLRAGSPVRWRRGQGTDSLVQVLLRRRGAAASDTLTLSFGAERVAETPPLARGVYDARVEGGASVVVVNASPELVPGAVLAQSGPVGGTALRSDAPRLSDSGWPYIAIALALCAEWLLRRRAGLR